MQQRILGLDLGSNSIGWALLEGENGRAEKLIDLGVRIFNRAVEDKTPIPKNAKRRGKRLGRRVIQRRSRRKKKLLNYLITLGLLPKDLKNHAEPEIILNGLGDPYALRKRALDEALTPYQLGRVLLHLIQRRGFLSNRKTLAGDIADDPDAKKELEKQEQGEIADASKSKRKAKKDDQDETAFLQDISMLRKEIKGSGCRTLGEYLADFKADECKRNRAMAGGHLRTDRGMYKKEFKLILKKQAQYHDCLTEKVRAELYEIIFKQRPIKLRPDRVGKCSLEPSCNRARIGRLEVQRARYLQEINHLEYFDYNAEIWVKLQKADRKILIDLFEHTASPTLSQIKKALKLGKAELNLESGNKKLKGNTTACKIRACWADWDTLTEEKQFELVECLLTIRKKSVLKNHLIKKWKLSKEIAIKLCLLEFEPGYSNLSTRATKRLLRYLKEGLIYSDARKSAGYDYQPEEIRRRDSLQHPPEIPNPIVSKGLHELRRLVNAVIAEYGIPDIIRIEMARDLEMNTKRYKAYIKQQKANTEANEEAAGAYRETAKDNPHLGLRDYPAREDKIRYRLWKDQGGCCAYSGRAINQATLFSAEVEIDHILPYSESLDNSYMNKVVSYVGVNRKKGQRTPKDAFSGDQEKWQQITAAIKKWGKALDKKKERFYMTGEEVQERDFLNSQLSDTRYISRVALHYLKPLGAEITTTKGQLVALMRTLWNLNDLLPDNRRLTDEKKKKIRSDHRHHAIDAVVIAATDRGIYRRLVHAAKETEKTTTELRLEKINLPPPWSELKKDLRTELARIVIAHHPQIKLSGGLHEDTGVGFIEGIGTVYRKPLNGEFKVNQVNNIIDETVKAQVRAHLERYGNKPKTAFSEGHPVLHKDGKTPIKRVRIRQSKTTLKKLQKEKLAMHNAQGRVFKWMAYGNIHHVEILQHKETKKYEGKFVTMMEASHRAKVTGKEQRKQPIVQTDHGEDYEFLMALHINELVNLEQDGKRMFYRVQKFIQAGRIALRLHTAATDNKTEGIIESIGTLIREYKLKKYRFNVLGKEIK